MDQMDLLKRIESKQQQHFHSITAAKNAPEKLTNTYSISKLLGKNQHNLWKYDLLEVYGIILPEDSAFVKGNCNNRWCLKLDENKKPLKFDLFENYLKITVEQVTRSSKYYKEFIPKEYLMQEDLIWSFAYDENNVDNDLYSAVCTLQVDEV
eukprot:jgi/Psemu1/292407/fgenesh1_pg.1040_\